jgi:hypothetical protein
MGGSTSLRRFVVATLRIDKRTFRGIIVRGALPAFAGALVLTGCGGSSGTPAAASSASSASATTTASTSAFETCLKQHGVKVTPGQFAGRPTGSFSPRAFPSGSRRAFPTGSPRPGASFGGANATAFKACAKYAPKGFGGGAGRAISSSALAAFKSCLTSNGVKVTGTTASQILSEVRSATGKTATAVHTCQVLLQPTAPTPTASA